MNAIDCNKIQHQLMPCFCIPPRSDRPRVYFHWPNFTYASPPESINPRRIHSTFSLKGKKTKPKRHLRRRHTFQPGTFFTTLGRRKKSHHSFTSSKTAPPTVETVVEPEMSDQYAPPPGPPPGYAARNTGGAQGQSQQHVSWGQTGRSSENASSNPFHNAHMNAPQGPPPSSNDLPPAYEPPPGPPPGHSEKEKAQPNDEYAPPPGPPPQHQAANEPEPPPYDPWMAVPDNALLPPPPSIHEERSPASNASWDDAALARNWCERNPLWQPRRQNQQTLSRIASGDIRLSAPPNTKNLQITEAGLGRTRVRSHPKCTDTILLTDIPLYAASTGQPRTIYFEIHVLSMGGHGTFRKEEADASIAIGFVAPPYPSWRQPGWHRASLGVHGDDGRRFVDDSFGGQDFVGAFRKHDTVGIGMKFSPPGYAGGKNKVEVFFTRNGKREGGWDLHEERDRDQDGGDVTGLEGDRDLLGTVGCFGGVEFELRCRQQDWMYKLSL
jgi:hypothetical protein